MASKSIVLLTLALLSVALALPLKEDVETTTPADSVELVDIIEVVDVIPVVPIEVEAVETTTVGAETKEVEHKVAKRDTLRADNPDNDLLAQLDGLNYESGLSSLEGRRIKFLPTWVG